MKVFDRSRLCGHRRPLAAILGLRVGLAQTAPAQPLPADEPTESETRGDHWRTALTEHCAGCHGEDGTAEGGVNLLRSLDQKTLGRSPELLRDVVHVLDTGYMPPEGEPELPAGLRGRLTERLATMLKQTLEGRDSARRTQLRRMTRFQYDTPLANLWLTCDEIMGVSLDRFADSTGVVSRLLS